MAHVSAMESTLAIEHPVKPALRNGWRRRCPRCGEGRVFESMLRVKPSCNQCGLDLTPQRADDGPAYLTILVVGHVMAVALHVVWTWFEPSPLVMATGLSTVAIALGLWLLPRFKGALIAYQ